MILNNLAKFGMAKFGALARSTDPRVQVHEQSEGSTSTSGTKVLLIGPVPAPLGGVSVHIARLAASLAGRGYDVRLLDESPIFKPGVSNIRTISMRNYVSLLRDADIVHTHSSNAIVKLIHVVAARVLGRCVISTIHSGKTDFWGRLIYRLACRLSHRVISVSEEVRVALRLDSDVIPAFLPPAAEEEVVPPDVAAWIAARRGEGRRIVVSNASNLRTADGNDLYGLDLLVETFARPEVARGHALLFVVASLRFGADRYETMRRQIEQHGLARVIRLVHLDAPFAGIIASSDIVVRATNTDGDALTVREGLWFGKRVLASDCVKRPEGCELFRTRDVDDLVSKLLDSSPDSVPSVLRRDFSADVERTYRSVAPATRAFADNIRPPAQRSPSKKRILVISQFYAPDITAAAFRISETVGLLRQDADVRVIAAVPHKAQAASGGGSETDDVMRVWIRPYQGGGPINYILHYLSFVVTAVWAGIRLRAGGWRADVIWVSSPPLFVGIAGDALRRIMRCPLVLDIRDIWPESAVGAKMIAADGVLFRVGKVLERWLYARADRITCVSRAMQGYLASASGKTVHVVYNGTLTRPPEPQAALVKRRILYAGNLGRAQGLDALLTAFADARRKSSALDGWTVEFVGAGAVEPELHACVTELELGEAVRFHGVLDKPAAISEMRQSAALFINLLSEAVFALTVPSKVFDYMLADRPILYGVDNPEAQGILAESGGNVEFVANDVSSLSVALVEMATRLNALETLAQGNSKVVLSGYTREAATRELCVALAAAQADPRPTLATKLRRRARATRLRWAREVAFARHVPVSRLVRRGVLTVKRQWLQRVHPAEMPVPAGLHVTTALVPAPLMAPREGPTIAADGAIVLRLLGVSKTLTLPISWRDPDHGRNAQLWWMTLNYMEYLEGTDDDLFASLVESWIAAAQPYGRGYWRDTFNSYAISIRTVVWMQQLARRSGLPTPLRERMIASIATQLQFLEDNLETDIGGNHLVRNIKALLLGSVFFEGPPADRWRELSLNLLKEELRRQILGDGVHFERSPSYHNQVFVDLLEMRYALGGDPLGGQLDHSLAAMAQAIADLAHADGRPAQFSDAGLSMSYTSADCLGAYERVFGSRPQRQTVFSYPHAGYFGLAGNDGLVVVDCGPIGPDDLPGHGHGDILSFEWSVGGKRLIVDQGVFEYVDGPRRTAARSASSHNTLSIEGLEQADFFSDFRVGRRPRPEVVRYAATPEGFILEGRHDGYAPFIHTRVLELSRNQLTILDRVDGGPAAGTVVGLLLHPEATIDASGPDIRIALGQKTVTVHATVPLDIEAAVWWPDMGVELPTKRLLARWPTGTSAASLTLSIE